MTEQPERSFFWTVAQRAGTQNRKNQLSSTFAACFTQSLWFRSVMAALKEAGIAAAYIRGWQFELPCPYRGTEVFSTNAAAPSPAVRARSPSPNRLHGRACGGGSALLG